MAVLEIKTDKPVLLSNLDVFFVTFKRNTNADDPAILWFDDDAESHPRYWQIERTNITDSSNNEALIYTGPEPYSFYLPFGGFDSTDEKTISIAFSLRQDVELPQSTSLKINARLTSDLDVVSTRLYYQNTYSPFEENSDLFAEQPSYNVPFEMDGTSQLLRTNPKLTGNIKITIDSNHEVSLNTFDANVELSSTKFKKYKVSPGSSYALDIKKLLDDGRVNPKTLFTTLGQDELSVKTDPSDQYKSFYWSGCEYLNSLLYDEPFSIFAPLWIDSKIPDYFIVFASNDVVLDPAKSNSANFKDSIIKNSRVVKSFSLKSDSNIGNYIRSIINSPVYKSSPLKANFENLKSISYRGIDYKNGVYTEKTELIDDIISEDLPITFFEKNVVEGFERNGLICYNLLNLEFLFEDKDALDYDIKRYFGFYIYENELSEFIIDGEAYSEEYSWISSKRLSPYNETSQDIFDRNGISILADISDSNVKLPSTELVNEAERIFYVKGKSQFYKIDHAEIISRIGADQNVKESGRIITSSNYLDLLDITGFSETKFIAESRIAKNLGFPFDISFENNFKDADAISIIYQRGKSQTEWKVIANSSVAKLGGTYKDAVKQESVIIQQNLTLVNVEEYDDFNIGLFIIPDILSFQIASDIFATYDSKSWSLEIAKVINDTNTLTTHLYLLDRTKRLVSNGNIGEVIYFEYSYEYFYNYFNPNGSLADCINSIKYAFDSIDSAKINTVTKESGIHIRTIFEQGSEFKIKIDLSNNHTDLTDVQVHGVNCNGYDIGDDILKISITDIKVPNERISFSIPISFSRNIDGSELVRSLKGNKSIKSYNIQGKNIYYLLNEDSNVIELELVDNSYPDIGKESKAVFYNIHKNTIGVMSLLPIVDFDTDFLNSDYSYSPADELKMFFYEFSAGENLPINGVWKIVGESGVLITINAVKSNGDTIEVDSFNLNNNKQSGNYIIHTIPALHPDTLGNLDITHFIVNEILPSNISKAIKIQHTIGWQKPEEISGYSVEGLLYERNLKNFEGFNGIIDFLDPVETDQIAQLKNINSPERFFYGFLMSEYDRLRENYSKELFNISRSTPTSMKWVIENGCDVRSNPYRLNASMAFGAKGFSPDSTIENPTSMFHTHEWYYLEGMPYWYSLDACKYDQNYTFNLVDDASLLELDYDGFSRCFIRGSYKEKYAGEVINSKTSNLFVNVEYNKELNKAGVFFKGAKFDLQVDNPAIYDGWRFTAVLRPMKRMPFSASDNVKITLFENSKWKTLCLVIDAYMPSYIFSNGNINLLGLYTQGSSKILSVNSNNDVYSTPADLQLTYGMNPTFGNASQNAQTGIVKIPAYGNLLNEIQSQANGNFNDFRVYGYGRRYLDSSLKELGIQIFGDSLSTIDQSALYFNYDNTSIEFSENAPAYEPSSNVDPQFNPPIHIDHAFDISSTFKNSSSFYIKGGENAISHTISQISFAAIVKKMTINEWTHHSISEDGIERITSGGKFMDIQYVSPSKILKKKMLEPYPDTDIPTELTSYDIIGFSMTETDNEIEITRYGGDFIPKMKPIFNFTATETPLFVDEFGDMSIKSNTHFFTQYSNFGVINNIGIHKVADKKILTLADTTYESRYPLINETGLDYKNLFALSGTWDYGFYQEYPDKIAHTLINPLSESLEQKAFIGSKLVNTPNSLLWEDFTFVDYKDNTVDFWYEIANKNTFQMHILTPNIIFSALNTTKLKDNIKKSIEPLRNDTLYSDAFVEEYIRLNLVRLYKISSIKLYSRGGTEDQSIYLNTNSEDRANLGFREDPGITMDVRLEDVLISRSITDLAYPQFTISITFDKI